VDPDDVVAAAVTADDNLSEAEDSGFGFLQKESSDPLVAEARNTLAPNKMYLDTCSSFHQIFTMMYLKNQEGIYHVVR